MLRCPVLGQVCSLTGGVIGVDVEKSHNTIDAGEADTVVSISKVFLCHSSAGQNLQASDEENTTQAQLLAP